MSALVRTASLETRSLADERARTLAQWVAANAIAEARLASPLPSSGQRRGEVDMGGRHWRWAMHISMATADGIRRLEVVVRPAQAPQAVLMLEACAVP